MRFTPHRLAAAVRDLHRQAPWLSLVLLTGFLLRLTGLFSGLPFPDPLEDTHHPDETTIIQGAILFPAHIWRNWSLDYPTFFSYSLALLTFPARLFIDWTDPHDVPLFVVTVAGRVCSTLAGTGAILLTYLVGRDLYDARRGLLASAFLCVSLYHAYNSSFVTPDVMTSFLLMLFLFLLSRALRAPAGLGRFVAAGVVYGCLVGTKYPGGIAVVAAGVLFVHAAITRWPAAPAERPAALRLLALQGIVCGVAAAAAFLVSTPGVVANFPLLVESFSSLQTRNMAGVQPRLDTGTWAHLASTVGTAVGAPLTVLSVAGLVLPTSRRLPQVALGATLLGYLGFLGTATLPRYVILVAPLLALLAANGCIWAMDRHRLMRPVAVTVIGVTLAYGLGNCLYGLYWRFGDTRTAAAHFLRDHVPPGTTIGLAYTTRHRPLDWLFWEFPKIEPDRFEYVDFVDYPEVVVKSSALPFAGREFEEPLRVLEDLADPTGGHYRLLASFSKRTLPFPAALAPFGLAFAKPEFASPGIDIFARHRYGPHTTLTSFHADDPRGYLEPVGTRRHWRLLQPGHAQATLDASATTPDGVLVNIAPPVPQAPWDVKLFRGGYDVRAGARYELVFSARARGERSVMVEVRGGRPPTRRSLGFAEEVVLTGAWRDFTMPVELETGDDDAHLYFNLGRAAGTVELAAVDLRRRGGSSVDGATPEYAVRYRFNELGCRGPDYVRPRPAEVLRIVALGDSATLGIGVHEADTFASQLQRRLRDRGAPDPAITAVDVINCGIAGTGVGSQVDFYRRVGSRYQADLVLLAVTPGDDGSWIDSLAGGGTERPAPFDVRWMTSIDAPTPDLGTLADAVLELADETAVRKARLAVVVFRYSAHERGAQVARVLERRLDGRGVPVLDLGPVLLTDHSEADLLAHPTAPHPSALAHRVAAGEIDAFLERIGGLTPSADRPSADESAAPARWRLIRAPDRTRLEIVANEPDGVRVQIDDGGTRPYDVQVETGQPPVRAGISYAASIRARADAPRTIGVHVSQNHAPWESLGLYRTIELTSEWQRFEFGFAATADDDGVRLAIDAGGSPISVDLTAPGLQPAPQP